MLKPTVLFIDDEQDVRKLVQLALQQGGYRVLTAENGPIGLRMSRAERPDVILLDIVMPGMDGHEVLRQLRADPLTKDIPVIMLTALGGDRNVAASLELGAVCHIEKPCQTQDLLQEVKLAIQKRRNASRPPPSASVNPPSSAHNSS